MSPYGTARLLGCQDERFPNREEADIYHGAEFTSKTARTWLQYLGVKSLYIEPDSPLENGIIDAFNGMLLDEVSNRKVFDTLLEAKALVGHWRRHYNESRPQMSLAYCTPQGILECM